MSRSNLRKRDTPRLAGSVLGAQPAQGLLGDPPVSLEPLTVRIPTALKLTGIGRSKLYELIASGDIEIVKVGSATLVTMASLRRLISGGATQ